MNVTSINSTQVAFKGRDTERKTGGAGKAFASAIIPGLGQFCDGRNKAGAFFLVGNLGLKAALIGLGLSFLKSAAKFAEKAESSIEAGKVPMPKGSIGKAIAMCTVSLAATGLWIADIVDAYKGGKKHKIKQEEE